MTKNEKTDILVNIMGELYTYIRPKEYIKEITMKFKRLLATILSALMVMSAFAFTAWAQEEEEA